MKAWELVLQGPTGEGAGALSHVRLGVVPDPHREQFQQFPAPVLVHRVGMVLVVVQPEDHGGAFRHRHEKFLVVTQALLAERIDHVCDLVVVVDLGHARRKQLVIKQAQLFL